MTTLNFHGATFSYQPTRLPATIAEQGAKYRGQAYQRYQHIHTEINNKGSKYRGVAY
ncbi:MAG: DUF4278 domain-containing protein [Limnothrix sp. RL_2_0]|nr:DUF4278 domain-containing protein [Limnothrix sp. RL_2_0]